MRKITEEFFELLSPFCASMFKRKSCGFLGDLGKDPPWSKHHFRQCGRQRPPQRKMKYATPKPGQTEAGHIHHETLLSIPWFPCKTFEQATYYVVTTVVVPPYANLQSIIYSIVYLRPKNNQTGQLKIPFSDQTSRCIAMDILPASSGSFPATNLHLDSLGIFQPAMFGYHRATPI